MPARKSRLVLNGHMAASTQQTAGDSFIYKALKGILEGADESLGEFTNRLIAATSIWWPTDLYAQLPTLLPWVTRDPSCRRPVDEWGSPDSRGMQRDDNSMIKNLTKSLQVLGPKGSEIVGSKIGNGFVASHVWRSDESKDSKGLRNPRTNSFVPNNVWLPSLVSKLSDRQGSSVMTSLQSLSRRIYSDVEVQEQYRDYVNDCWSTLPVSSTSTETIDVTQLHYFSVDDKFIDRRKRKIREVSTLLECALSGKFDPRAFKGLSSRYVAGITAIDSRSIDKLRKELAIFL